LQSGNLEKTCRVRPTITISKLSQKAAILFELPIEVVVLMHDDRILRSSLSLQHCGIFGETALLVKVTGRPKSVKYVPNETPTHAFHQSGLSDILLDVIRGNCSQAARKPVWRLLKMLETNEIVRNTASTADGAIALIDSAKTPLDLLYSLQCVSLAARSNPQLYGPIAESLLTAMREEKIDGKALPAAFQIACKGQSETLKQSAKWLLPFLLRKLTELKTSHIQENSLQLLFCLAKADPKATCDLLLTNPFANLFLNLSVPALQYLRSVFAKLPRKEQVFAFLVPFVSKTEQFPTLCPMFFALFDGIGTEECDITDTVRFILSNLPTTTSVYRTGLSTVLELIFKQKPSEMQGHLDCVTVLVPIVSEETDPTRQQILLRVLSRLVKVHPTTSSRIAELLRIPFSIPLRKWNFDAALLRRNSGFTGLGDLGAPPPAFRHHHRTESGIVAQAALLSMRTYEIND
jgi:hypothetical protein